MCSHQPQLAHQTSLTYLYGRAKVLSIRACYIQACVDVTLYYMYDVYVMLHGPDEIGSINYIVMLHVRANDTQACE